MSKMWRMEKRRRGHDTGPKRPSNDNGRRERRKEEPKRRAEGGFRGRVWAGDEEGRRKALELFRMLLVVLSPSADDLVYPSLNFFGTRCFFALMLVIVFLGGAMRRRGMR
jgi:hypothetical protein